MSLLYAKNLPQGSSNYVKAVAIVGAGGQIGKLIAEALVKTGKHDVTAITRQGSTNEIPQGVTAAVVDYNDETSLVSALKGKEFLIITLSLSAPADTHSKLVRAAAEAGVTYVIANAYGVDVYGKESLRKDLPVGEKIVSNIRHAEETGLTWFAFFTGPWYEYSLTVGPELLGFDLKTRTATFYDDGTTAVNFSTLPQIARAVAALLSLKKFPADEDDGSVTLSQFANGPVYVSSFHLSQRDVLESLKRVTKTRDSEWRITYESTEERYKEGMRLIAEGKLEGFGKSLFARAFYPNGDGTYEDVNKLLGLPEEDLDGATLAAINSSIRT
ncbi:hypothetical protein BDV36DRAFT_276306 [Aspergillus pseudocaelatus]|uniref:NmrA-like domain-containing protein n=1 Tax=Aspergillus pseudocaelatus TaxID=1825620 RepID=A0ABQ6W1A6_9EURO|nr:hypothetical protein BDV36DRAFT_276306 [Aspergillus pseudocaelatus]